ncbi:hypothetical protein [Flavobacterium pedocola]
MKLYTFIFCLLFLNLHAQEKKVQENIYQIDAIVKKIAAKDIIVWGRNERNNYFIKDSLFNKLIEIADDTKLISLCQNNNGNVRHYAFNALAEKSNENCFRIVLENLKDTTTIRERWGCVVGKVYVTDFWIFLISGNAWKSNYKLNEVQQKRLDSLLISDKSIKLGSRLNAIAELKTSPENYQTIKSLVIKEKSGVALSLLAAYQKPEDIKLIASFFNKKGYQSSFLSAVEKFPDVSFYNSVLKCVTIQKKKNIYDSTVAWIYICKALSKYPTQETTALFEKMMEEKDNYTKETLTKSIYLAITKNPNPIFDPIKAKINITDEELEEIKMLNELYNY